MRRPLNGRREDAGASLVEFALVLPLLVLLLFGIIEFGWAFAQNLEVKHIAREVGRIATVGDPDGVLDTRACSGTIADITNVTDIDADAGDTVNITVTAGLQQITGLFGWVFDGVGDLQSSVEVRMEQPLTWGGTTCGS